MKKFLFCLIILLSLYNINLSATPMGGEISYQCIGNGKYNVFIKLYRDCNDTTLLQADLIAYCSSDTLRISQQTKLSTRDITGVGLNCSVASKCSGTFQYGYEEIVWKMELDLSSYSCCEWNLAWEKCCRSSSIWTGSANQNFYLKATLNKCVISCNSSPVFSRPPQILICQGHDFVYNMGAMDTVDNGDSLSYSFVPAYQSATNQVSYTGNSTPSRPLTFIGFPNQNLPLPAGFHLDPVTGDLAFRPAVINQMAVFVIQVKEWRKIAGVKTVIGITNRDFVIHVISCPNNNNPRLDPPYSIQTCAGSKTCIQIVSDDNDSQDSVYLTWENPIKGASFTNNNGLVKKASGQVCWTPHDTDARTLPYFFTIKARDNYCALNVAASRAYSFFVNPSPKIELKTKVINCGQVAFDHTVIDSLNGFLYKYEFRDTQENLLQSSYMKTDTMTLSPGIYYLDLLIDHAFNCQYTIRDTIEIQDYSQVVLPKDTNICIGDTLKLSALINTKDSIISSSWRDLILNQDLGLSGNYLSNFSLSNSRWSFRITDSKGCTHSDSVNVHIRSLPKLNLKPYQSMCYGDTVKIDRGLDSAGWTYSWSVGGSGQIINVLSPKTVVLSITDSYRCKNNDTIRVNLMSDALNYVRDTSVCEGEILKLIPPGSDSVAYYDFDSFNSASIPLFTGDSVQFLVNKSQRFLMKATNYKGNSHCNVYKSFVVSKLLLPPLNLGLDKNICNGDSIALNPLTSSQSLDYLWNTGQTLSSIWVRDSGEYFLRVIDKQGCISKDTLKIRINSETVDAGMDQSICLNDTVNLIATGADSFFWYDLAMYTHGSLNTPVNNKAGYSYLVSQNNSWIVEGVKTENGTKCLDMDTVEVEAYPWKAILSIQGELFPIDNIPSYSYSIDTSMQDSIYWSLVNGIILNGQGTGEIEVHWDKKPNASIKVVGLSSHGCKSEYSKNIYVLKNSIISSPNGSFYIYPNPAKNRLNIDLKEYRGPCIYEIFDQLGQATCNGLLVQKNSQLNIENLLPGIYSLRIEGVGKLNFIVVN